MTTKNDWKDCNFYKSFAQGRDFVVQDPDTKALYEGYFSGEQETLATATTDGDHLELGGKAKLRQQTTNSVIVLFLIL